MKDLREDFVKKIKEIPIEKEPKTEGIDLTEDEINKHLESYKKVLKSNILKDVFGEEMER